MQQISNQKAGVFPSNELSSFDKGLLHMFSHTQKFDIRYYNILDTFILVLEEDEVVFCFIAFSLFCLQSYVKWNKPAESACIV